MTTQTKYVDRTVLANGINIHYLEWGDADAPTLIALHGLRGHGHTWDSFSEAMSGELHILALDQRGRGTTDWAPDGDYGDEAYVKDIEGFCEALSLDNFVLMGHSMGGRNSMIFSARNPSRVSRLILVDVGPTLDPKGGERIRQEIIAAREEYDSMEELIQLQARSNPLLAPELLRRRTIYQTRELADGKVVWRYDLAIRQQIREDRRPPREDIWPLIPNISCPTLIVRGMETDILPLEVANKMVEVMPQAELAQVERAAHMVMEDNSEGYLEAARDFLYRTG